MQFLNYFLASVISFSGLLVGILLIKIAPEEQKPLSKYFVLMRKILSFLIFGFLLFYFYGQWRSLSIVMVFFIFLLLFELKIKDLFKKSLVGYFVFGVLLYMSSKNINLFIIESSLILLYGLPTGSLLYNKKEKNYFKVLFYHFSFVLIANFLYLLITTPHF